jgi:hypothetical protein
MMPSPQRQILATAFSRSAAGPGRPTDALTATEDVGGTQNKATLVGSKAFSLQEPTLQSALLVQAPTLGSSVQYVPSGEDTPLRVIVFSKQRRGDWMQVPAPKTEQSASTTQLMKEAAEQLCRPGVPESQFS